MGQFFLLRIKLNCSELKSEQNGGAKANKKKLILRERKCYYGTYCKTESKIIVIK